MKHLIPFVLVVAWAAAALAGGPDLCRDYVPKPLEECMYPTEKTHAGNLRVCRCPGSQPARCP